MSEATARFGFLAAVGLSALGAAAALSLGLNDQRLAAAGFLGLALLGLAAMSWFRRIYVQQRSIRWQQELRQSQAALDALLQPTPPTAPPAPAEAAPVPLDHHVRT